MICLRQRGCPVICASLVLVGRAHGRSPEAFFVRRRGEHLHVAADADVTVARERHKLAAAFSKEIGGRADKTRPEHGYLMSMRSVGFG